jgi:hypothetical protein
MTDTDHNPQFTLAERLSVYISSNNHPLHHASPYVIIEALEACGLTLVGEAASGRLYALAYELYTRADGEEHPYLIGPLHHFLASADTRPEGGDATEIAAPFTSGAVAKPDAQKHPNEYPHP